MKDVEGVLEKRYEVSAGKARVAKDMVDMAEIQEKEGERKALERTRWPSSSPARACSPGAAAPPRRRTKWALVWLRLPTTDFQRPRHSQFPTPKESAGSAWRLGVGGALEVGRWKLVVFELEYLHMDQQPSKLTPLGRLISLVLVVGLVALGAYMVSDRSVRAGRAADRGSARSGGDAGEAPAVVDFKVEVPRLAPAAPFTMKDNIVPIEISEYAGYAGLIAANGGLAPSENSFFFKNGGFKVKLTVSEDESWADLNAGKIAALGHHRRRARGLRPAVPRRGAGADRLLARRRRPGRPQRHQEDQRLKGKTGRHRAVHRGRLLHPLPRPGGRPVDQHAEQPRRHAEPDRINVVYTEGGPRRASCSSTTSSPATRGWPAAMTWEPKVVRGRREERRAPPVLVTNKNLLVVADVLVAAPRLRRSATRRWSQGLVQGLLEGNRMVRGKPRRATRHHRQGVQVDARRRARRAGQGPPVEPAREPRVLLRRDRRGRQLRRHLPVGGARLRQRPDQGSAERGPLRQPGRAARRSRGPASSRTRRSRSRRSAAAAPARSRAIRSCQQGHPVPVRAELRDARPRGTRTNLGNLDVIKRMLQVSPGSTMLLRGHVDNAMVDEFRKKGGEEFVRRRPSRRWSCRKQRAGEHPADARSRGSAWIRKRIEVVGRGWEEPVSAGLGREPARRGAVVHESNSRVAVGRGRPPTRETAYMPLLYTKLQRRFGKPQDGLSRREMLKVTLAASAGLLLSGSGALRSRPAPTRRGSPELGG